MVKIAVTQEDRERNEFEEKGWIGRQQWFVGGSVKGNEVERIGREEVAVIGFVVCQRTCSLQPVRATLGWMIL